ncbi:MAG: hypothetical protein ACYCWE_03885 [Eubacteriales bacterium]
MKRYSKGSILKYFIISALAFMLVFVVSCVEKGAITPSETLQTSVTEIAESETQPMPSLPQVNYEDAAFTFLVTDTGYFGTTDILVEKMDGEPLNDAIYERNSIIEEKYGIKISEVRTDDVPGTAKKAITAGDDSYDAAFSQRTIIALASAGYLIDFNELPYIDRSMPWWDTNIFEGYAINGKSYFATGDISLMDDDCTLLIVFNKFLTEQNNLDNPYALVEENKWTIDVFGEMSKSVYNDINGNSLYDQDDVYGVSLAYDHINYYYTACGLRFTSVSKADKIPVVEMLSDRSVGAFEKLMDIFTDEQSSYFINKLKTDMIPHTYSRIQFTQDLYLFTIAEPLIFTEFRDMEHDFGFLPLPMYDENQDGYYTPYDTAVTSMVVPITVSDIERCGIILEAMAAQSLYTVKDIYYDTLLKRKYSRDNESEAMLDIVMNTRTYDLMFIFSWQNMNSIMTNLLQAGSYDLASKYEAVIEKTQTAINKTFEEYQE